MTTAINCDYSVAGDGPPLILIHGIGAARDTWRYAIDQLTSHFTVVTYDLRGHGTSPAPTKTAQRCLVSLKRWNKKALLTSSRR